MCTCSSRMPRHCSAPALHVNRPASGARPLIRTKLTFTMLTFEPRPNPRPARELDWPLALIPIA